MKNFTLKISMLATVLISLTINAAGQTAIPATLAPSPANRISKAQLEQLRNYNTAVGYRRALQSIVLDYDAVDDIETVNNGGTYERFIWDLNSRFDENDTSLFGLQWGVVRFDTLYDAATLIGYPRSSTPFTFDSIDIAITHENVTGTPDTIQVSVYAWQGALGIQVNAQEQITNAVLFDTLIITTTSLTPGATQLRLLTVYPNLTLNFPNNRFSVGVHFYGDTANTFTLLAGYGDRCNGSCFAVPSAFDLNSIYRMIAWAGQISVTGINSVAYDCNQNGNVGEDAFCEDFPIQNFGITVYGTIDPQVTCNLTASISPPAGATVCSGESIVLTASVSGGSAPYTYMWSIGSTTASIIVTPSSTTTYTITMTDNNGCTATASRTVVVYPKPTASYTYTNIQNVYTFQNSTTGFNYLQYSWDFGDGGSSTQQDPVHTYSPGTYNTCLIVYDSLPVNFYCFDTLCATITAFGTTSCSASFSYTNSQNDFTFQNTSLGVAPFQSFDWTFGDGDTSSQENPAHTYNASGYYNVCLQVVDSAGCQSSFCDTITVGNTGVCDASFIYTVSGRDVTFTNTSTPGLLMSSFWTFGDGANSSSNNPTHTYAQNGTYQVCLTMIDNNSGCADNICLSILISNTSQQLYCLTGNVKKGAPATPADPATVYLIYNDTALGTLTMIATATTNASGNYQFCSVPVGKYLVKAAMNPGAQGYSSYVPTYYGNSLFWSYATEVLLTQNFQSVDIWLISGNNPGGPGFIGGYVNQGANKMLGPGDPVEAVQVFLLDMNDIPIQYTFSDDDGWFEFSNLAYGTYKVFAEVPGIPTTPFLVTISADVPTVDNVSVLVESTQVISDVEVPGALSGSVKVYPNPAHDEVYVEWTQPIDGEMTVTITDINGNAVVEEILFMSGVSNKSRFELSQLQPGIYLMRLSGEKETKTIKIVKH